MSLAYGPAVPNPVMAQWISLGLAAQRAAACTPQPLVVPGENASMITSALLASARSVSWPAGVRRSATRLSLPRFQTRKPLGIAVRSRSPSGGSSLMTRAPASASTMPVIDAAMLPAPISMTFRPAQIPLIDYLKR